MHPDTLMAVALAKSVYADLIVPVEVHKINITGRCDASFILQLLHFTI